MKNPYLPVEARIEKIIQETSNIKTFVLKAKEELIFKTGQFAELTVPGFGEAPFTPSSSPHETKKLELTIMKAGKVTGKLHEMKEGENVGIRGPYGNGYPLEEVYGKEILILGGGVGMAPLRSLLFALQKEEKKFKRIILCYGVRTPEDVIYKRSWSEWKNDKKLEVHRSVDKADAGWKETEGVVTVLLDKFKMNLKNSACFVCGPPVMMKFATKKLIEIRHLPENIYLSMERNMSCGIGKCGHCQIGKFFVCKDGPVFKYSLLKDEPELWK